MRKAIKKIAMLFMVCGLAISVSFGVDLYGNEENYQKLKVEMEEVESSEYWDRVEVTCSWDKDGKVVVGGRLSRSNKGLAEDWCHLKNVLAFFDELRAMEVEKDNLNLAIAKVREMPRFKEDSGIYSYVEGNYKNQAVFNDYAFWKRVFEKWKMTKLSIEAEEPRINKTYFR